VESGELVGLFFQELGKGPKTVGSRKERPKSAPLADRSAQEGNSGQIIKVVGAWLNQEIKGVVRIFNRKSDAKGKNF